jgi:hypothetical protein
MPSKRLRQFASSLPALGPFTIEKAQQKVNDNPDLEAEVLCNIIKGIQTYPFQCSLITQVQGRPLSPRSIQNIVWADANLNPDLLQELINGLVLTFKG